MASYQYVYHMEGVSKTYPGGKKCFENIHLNFLPGVKIGVVGVNGSGKSTLLKIMAGHGQGFSRARHGPPKAPASAIWRRNRIWTSRSTARTTSCWALPKNRRS